MQQRQTLQIGIIALPHHLLTLTATRHALREPLRHIGKQRQHLHLIPHRSLGAQRITQQSLDATAYILQPLHAESHSHTALRAHHIGQYGKLSASIFKQQRLATALALCLTVGQLGNLKARRYGRFDPNQLTLALQTRDIFLQVFIHYFNGVYGTLYLSSSVRMAFSCIALSANRANCVA